MSGFDLARGLNETVEAAKRKARRRRLDEMGGLAAPGMRGAAQQLAAQVGDLQKQCEDMSHQVPPELGEQLMKAEELLHQARQQIQQASWRLA